jgi:plasmid stability protein
MTKTSIDLPDGLYRQLKAKSAMEGRTVREVATELFRAYVAEAGADSAPLAAAPVRATQARPPDPEVAAFIERWEALSADLEREGVSGLVDQLYRDRR